MRAARVAPAPVTVLGAEAIADVLVREGIDRLFLFPGGTIAPLLDAALARGIALVCARHEQGAGYAALGMARVLGRPQVVAVTSGPGVTNVVTPVADAYFDSVPLVVLTGQVGTGDQRGERPVRQRGFQEVDTAALMRPIAKAVLVPRAVSELAGTMAEAFRVATSGRPGPVVVDLAMDLQRAAVESGSAGGLPAPGDGPRRAGARQANPLGGAHPRTPASLRRGLETAAAWLASARRPVIVAGQGALGARDDVRALAALGGGIPVVASLLGLGVVPTDAPLALGYLGHTGSRYANRAVHEADLVVVIGARLDVRQTGSRTGDFVPRGRVVRIEMDPAELAHARVRCDLALEGDAAVLVRELRRRVATLALADWAEWRAQVTAWKRNFPLAYGTATGEPKPQRVIEAVDALTAGLPAIVVSGVGSHQQWVARHFTFDHPQRCWLTSGGHGAMGFDLPVAIGAQLAAPDRPVFCFVGDGSLQINIQELQAAVELGTPVRIIVLDNRRLGIVSQFQKLNWASDPATGDKRNPDFAAIARAWGLAAWTIACDADVEPVLRAALVSAGPVLVHCLVDPAEDVVPMLLAGQTMDRMWPDLEEEDR